MTKWMEASSVPVVPFGSYRNFIVAIRAIDGQIQSREALYLNHYYIPWGESDEFKAATGWCVIYEDKRTSFFDIMEITREIDRLWNRKPALTATIRS